MNTTKTKTREPKESEAILAIFRTADRLGRFFASILSRHGLTLQQYNVLRILRGAGELPTMAIRDRMMEKAPGVTRILDGLVAKGLVERTLPESDRRRVLCRLTQAGTDLLALLDTPIQQADRDAFAALGPAELGRMVRSLQTVEAGLAED